MADTQFPAHMGTGNTVHPLGYARWVILALLLGMAAVSWLALLAWGAHAGGTGMSGLTMGLGPALFLVAWLVMMVAMMFPTAAPMILMFARVRAGKQRRNQAVVSTWVFVAGYLTLWTAFGVPVYALAVVTERVVSQVGLSSLELARIGGVLIVLAGVYQLSPLKNACLAHCRSPLHFVLTQWRDGIAGALEMGAKHGMYCVGCCWLLFLILLPLGLMNVGLMVLITLLIFAEKSLPISRYARVAAAVALVGYGALVLLDPRVLPTAMGMA